MCPLLSYVASVIIMPPKAAAAKPKPKAVKARVIVDAVDENGRPRGLLERAKIIAQKRRPKKPLTDLFTKIAEKSTVDVSQVRGIFVRMGPRGVPGGSPFLKAPSSGPQSLRSDGVSPHDRLERARRLQAPRNRYLLP